MVVPLPRFTYIRDIIYELLQGGYDEFHEAFAGGMPLAGRYMLKRYSA